MESQSQTQNTVTATVNPWNVFSRRLYEMNPNLGAAAEEIMGHMFSDYISIKIEDGVADLAVGSVVTEIFEKVMRKSPVTWDVYFDIPEHFSEARVRHIVALGLYQMEIGFLTGEEEPVARVAKLKSMDENDVEAFLDSLSEEVRIPFTIFRKNATELRARVATGKDILMMIHWDDIAYCTEAKGYCRGGLSELPY